MHRFFTTVSNWASYFRAPSEALLEVWFEGLVSVFDGQEAAIRMQYAGWYHTREGMQLFPLPKEESVRTQEIPSSEPLYRVRVLSLPEIRMYHSVCAVDISQRTMTVSPSAGVADDEVRELEILIQDTVFAHNSRRICFRRIRHAVSPVWKRYEVVHAKTNQHVSLHEIILIKSIVDAALQKANLLQHT